MPPPRKIDQMPPELRDWLKAELVARGFGEYEALAEALNFRLEEAGLEIRVQKSAIHAYGQEYREFVRLQEASSAWAEEWMSENGLGDEARRHNVLFQMITSLAFKLMQGQMARDAKELNAQELHFLGRMMKDVMQSAGVREQMIAADRKAQAARLDAAVASGDIDGEAAAKARRIMGFA